MLAALLKVGSPARWIARIEGDLEYQKKTVRVIYEFHYDQGKWVLYGYRKVS
jgi:hypothetical protein